MLKTDGWIQIDLSSDSSGPGILLWMIEYNHPMGEINTLHFVNVGQNI